MLFNSFQFLVFIAIVIPAYFLLPQKFRWVFLLAASYYFYMSWNVVYILLLFASTLVNYLIARRIDRIEERRGRLAFLWLSVALSFGTLFLFKYYDFTAGLLGGLLVILAVQVVVMALYAYFVVFRVLGKNYDAAIMCSGLCGHGLGATPSAIVNMTAVTEKYGMSRRAFMVVPIVGAFLVDIIYQPQTIAFIKFFVHGFTG